MKAYTRISKNRMKKNKVIFPGKRKDPQIYNSREFNCESTLGCIVAALIEKEERERIIRKESESDNNERV